MLFIVLQRDPRKLGSVSVRWGSLTLDAGSVSGVMSSEADEACREQVNRWGGSVE
jgi:hypothetical protein